MKCAWETFKNLLPYWMRREVDELRQDLLQELRLRVGLPPELLLQSSSVFLQQIVTADDIAYTINTASAYSPWAAQTLSKGYITASGGHRLGICGDAVVNNGSMTGIRNVTSVCLRIARDFPDIAENADALSGSILIIGKPGSGKTTLLRDLIRRRSNLSGCVAVVDEKGELFPKCDGKLCFDAGKRTDVLSGCTKEHGISAVLRNMSPNTIAVDEITATEDCNALINAAWCGVDLLATTHAGSKHDLYNRAVYRPLIENRIFQTLIILHPDKSWTAERMNK